VQDKVLKCTETVHDKVLKCTETVQDKVLKCTLLHIKCVKDGSQERKSLFVFPKILSVLKKRILDDNMTLSLLSAVERVHFVVSLHEGGNVNFLRQKKTASAGTIHFYFAVHFTLFNRMCFVNSHAHAGSQGDKDQGHDKIDFLYIRGGVINI
jgi:hypothetical protein